MTTHFDLLDWFIFPHGNKQFWIGKCGQRLELYDRNIAQPNQYFYGKTSTITCSSESGYNNYVPTYLRIDEQRYLMYIPWLQPSIWQWDPKEKQLNALELLPPGLQFRTNAMRERAIAMDACGNLLLFCKDAADQPVTLLWEKTTGELYNYSEVFSADALFSAPHKTSDVWSPDFRKMIYYCSGHGLTTTAVIDATFIQQLDLGATRNVVAITDTDYLIQSRVLPYLFRYRLTDRSLVLFLQNQSDIPSPAIILNPIRIDSQIWVPGYPNDLYRCSLDGTDCQRFSLAPIEGQERMLQWDERQLLLAFKGELHFFDLIDHTITPYQENGLSRIFGLNFHELYKDKAGILWAATSEGLWQVDIERNTSIHFSQANTGFADDRFLCLEPAPDGKLWLGTFAGGIQVFDPADQSVEVISVDQGLSSNTVVGLIRDRDNVWWASTHNGLSLIGPNGQVKTKLYEYDGLSNNEFNRFSSLQARDGTLFFGTIKGMNVLQAEQLKTRFSEGETVQLYLRRLSYYSNEQASDVVLSYPQEIERLSIPAHQRYLKVDFNLSSLIQPDQHRFAYQLDGHRKDWTEVGNQTSLSLINLPPGKYHLRIRGWDYRDNQAQEDILIPLFVHQVFYKQTWFYLLIGSLLTGGILIYVVSLRRINKQLEATVERRTAKIREDKETIEQLNRTQARFFANISHEFKTPLTLIMGMTNQIRKNPKQ